MDVLDRDWSSGTQPGESVPDAHPKFDDYSNPAEYQADSNAWHENNVGEFDIEEIRKMMEKENERIEGERDALDNQVEQDLVDEAGEEEVLVGEEEAEVVEDAVGPFGWIAAGVTGLAILATLATLGYTAYEIATLQKQAAALPPDSAMPLPPPGKVIPPSGVLKPPQVVYYGVNPDLFVNRRKKSKRKFGFM